MVKKKFNSLLLIFFLIIVFGLLAARFQEPKNVRAGLNQNMSGWAWSDIPNSTNGAPNSGIQGIGGWISLNSLTSGGVDYGVDVDTAPCSGGSAGQGCVTGYAWSDIPNSPAGTPMGAGWISFNPSDWGGCPPFGSCYAYVDHSTGFVKGWARALAGKDPQAGGWDGWISLDAASAVGGMPVEVGNCGWQGWAWGSDLVGWISFSSTTDPLTPNGVNYQATGMANCTSTATLIILPRGPITLVLVDHPQQQLDAWYDSDGPGGAPAERVTNEAAWTSSDSGIISVDKGLLTAGNTRATGITITATYFTSAKAEASVIANVLPQGTLHEIPPGGEQ